MLGFFLTLKISLDDLIPLLEDGTLGLADR